MNDINIIDLQDGVLNSNNWVEFYNNLSNQPVYDINFNLIPAHQLNTRNLVEIPYDSDSSLETLDSHSSDLESLTDNDNIDPIEYNNLNISDEILRNPISPNIFDSDTDLAINESFENYNNNENKIDKEVVKNILSKLKDKSNKKICNCAICLEEIKKNTKVYKLKCKHKFHKQCLKDWLNQKLECPMCRSDI